MLSYDLPEFALNVLLYADDFSPDEWDKRDTLMMEGGF